VFRSGKSAMSTNGSKKTGTATPHRRQAESELRDVVLICNPQAGGRWKELADILDAEEARNVRRIVTDSIEDIGPALPQLRDAKLLCIYGGDGTIHRVLERLIQQRKASLPQLAFLGGGTMNVTAGWCGLRASPVENFREVMSAYRSGQLLLKEVPLLEVQQGDRVRHGFTFGIGPIIRVLNAYERGGKGKIAALATMVKALAATWSQIPADFRPMLQEMDAEIWIDGRRLPFSRYSAVFCNVTGRINIAVQPFVKVRSRETFYCVAYAVSRRELVLLLPFLIRGRLPLDPKSLLKPVSTWKQIVLSYLGKGSFPIDPRYVNATASVFEIQTTEELFTLDGEIIRGNGEPIAVNLGQTVKLVVGSTVALGPTMRLAAEVARPLSSGSPATRTRRRPS
jgi:hypothetical protein